MMRDREFWLLLVLCAAVTILIVFATGGLDVSAAQVEPQATATPIATCDLWKTAGGLPVYRCTDEDMYVICYSQGAMLFCLEQP